MSDDALGKVVLSYDESFQDLVCIAAEEALFSISMVCYKRDFMRTPEPFLVVLII